MASTVLPNGIIIPEKFSRDWYSDLYHNWEELDNLLGGGTPKDGTLTIQKNGTAVGTFSANQATDETVNITVPTKTSDLTNDSGFLTSADALPIGSYIQFAGSQAPAGFLVCNGGAISRTTYSQLFAVIGTTYGSGDGSTTFNVPDLIGRFLEGGSASGTVFEAGLPNITGFFDYFSTYGSSIGNMWDSYGGAFFNRNKATGDTIANGGNSDGLGMPGFDASRSNSIYGNSSTVQPNAITCLICIKY